MKKDEEVEETTHVILSCAYYQGRRVVEDALCGNCQKNVYEDETHCGECGTKLDWENTVENEHGNFMSIYR